MQIISPRRFAPTFAIVFSLLAAKQLEAKVSTPSQTVRATFNLSPFYEQYVDVHGFPIVASSKVSPYALLEAQYLIEKMVGHRPDILKALAKNKVRFAIMAHNEFTTDIPEHHDLEPKLYWNKRARGLGATPHRPAVTCGEENLLGYTNDPYRTENILIHEFAHAIHNMGLSSLDPSFDTRLEAAYDAAMKKGLWGAKYAAQNHNEYWAEGVQSWFDTNRENDSSHNHVNTRTELKQYDSRLAALVEEIFGDRPWRYRLPKNRTKQPKHLAEYDAAAAPVFEWRKQELDWYRQFEAGKKTMAPAGARSLHLLSWPTKPLRSKASQTKTVVYISNASSRMVKLEWIDFDGKPQGYGALQPKAQTQQHSYAGHIFRFLDAQTQAILGYFAVPKSTAVMTLQDSSLAMIDLQAEKK